MISFGIESVDPGILNEVKKPITVEQIYKAIELTKKCKILTTGHFIFGLPGETIESAMETLKTAKELDLDFAQFYCAVPFPGSKLYNIALDKGWIKNQSFEGFRQEKAVMSLPTITSEQVERIRKQTTREFYGRLGILKNLLKLVNLKAFGSILTSSLKFIRNIR